MIVNNNPIAVIDSGVGGLTVVKELQKLLPEENIIYFGDNKNVPYGSKSQTEVIQLTKKMIDFLIEQDVKLIGVGCNTISTTLDLIIPEYDVKIIGIIDPVLNHISNISNLNKIGLIATPFTVNSNYYSRTLAAINANIEVVQEGSPQLAAAIDKGDFNKNELKKIIESHIPHVIANGDVDSIILGCTHYPIILDLFQEVYPDLNFINPAFSQALAIKDYLSENNLLTNTINKGYFKVYTTGEVEKYEKLIKTLDIKKPDKIINLL